MSHPLWYQCPWFHGTNVNFNDWLIPPPPKPGEGALVRHTALFFSSNQIFASQAGSGLCKTELMPAAKVLDATLPSAESEMLRQRLMKNQLASLSVHINDPVRWKDGWRSGEVLRFAFSDTNAAVHLAQSAAALVKKGMPMEAAVVLTQHNTTRGLIELICLEARALGYDALVGMEVDQQQGKRLPVPWLAVFNTKALAPLEWVTRPT